MRLILTAARSFLLGAIALGGLSACFNPGETPADSKAGAPSQLRYLQNPAHYTQTVMVVPNTVQAIGSPVQSFTIKPDLPEGLSFDPKTGTISGTPVRMVSAAEYIVTARNGYGSNFVRLVISVDDFPPAMSYSGATTLTFKVGVAIVSTITPTLAGGLTLECRSSPSLPDGLTLSSACEISGTPLKAAPQNVYTVSAVNSGGASTIPFTITVIDLPPVFSYSGGPYAWHRGSAVSTLTPSNSGGVISSCSSNPALPAGVALSSDCIISGTPTQVAASASYTITGTNNGGSASQNITFAVTDFVPNISYAGSPFKYARGKRISTLLPANTGGLIDSCGISPALPAGLSLDVTNCQITGIPTGVSAAADYTVTASNSAGGGPTTINIAVNDIPPSLVYSGSTFVFTNGTTITNVQPLIGSGGAVTGCSSNPTLPNGLSLASDCTLTGKPLVAASANNYTITATNSGGSSSAVLNIKVNEIPPVISFPAAPFTLNRNVAIAPKSPTASGGAIVSCTAAPALPSGLALSNACVISGTPGAVTTGASYAIIASNSAGSSTANVTITVNDTPPTLSYVGSPYQYTLSSPIATLTPSNSGGAITSCGSIPVLPAGLNLANDCVISGTPNALSPAANYVITATNGGGTASATINITVKDTAPNLSYAGSPYALTINAVASISATNTGGAITLCNVSPALPSGLLLNTTTCAISGTPNAVVASASYTVTAANSGGTSIAALVIAVDDLKPVLSYTPALQVLEKDTTNANLTPTNTGGSIVSCSVAPALPSGLTLAAPPNCGISGKASVIRVATDYTITAANSGGSTTAVVNLTVNDKAPILSYTGSPFAWTKGTSIGSLNPDANAGGAIVSCTVTPALPAGLALSNVCVISGTPTAVAAGADCTITATNSGGSVSASIHVTVKDVAPNISYSAGSFIYAVGSAIPAEAPANSGGSIVSCASSPVLPAGLSLSSGCTIAGTPAAPVAADNYTITATNTGGTSSKVLNIEVQDVVPAISYAGAPYIFKRTFAVSKTPSNTGGAITSCAINPALPAGLSLSSGCEVSGSATGTLPATDYTITPHNSGGDGAPVAVNITVNPAPPVLSYLGSPFAYTRNSAISVLNPGNMGDAITSCTSDVALPSGLSLSTGCVLSGTPTILTPAANYTITAANDGGSSSTTISIAVVDLPPNIDYIPTSYDFTYMKGQLIAPLAANDSGGAIVTCASSPDLPTGLALSNSCGISGTPQVLREKQNYTITATNSGGTSAVVIAITVNDIAPVPAYSGGPFTFTLNSAIATLSPTSTGGAIVSCAANPMLPAGLVLSNGCVISGTPTALAVAANYTITATNSGGSSSTLVNITVQDVAPTLAYPVGPFIYTKGVAVASLTPTNTGGPIVGCSSSPTLPAGLALSSSCAISGTPSDIAAVTDYTVTATNSGGTGTATVRITVNDGPPILSYSGSPFVYTKGTAIAAVTPSNTGGAITTCDSSPALPAGLSLSADCVITGTPSQVSAAANYTITSHNIYGDSPAQVNITVKDIAPVISFTPNSYVFVLRTAIASVTPGNTGGAITSCNVSPALPNGLAISAGCVISGSSTVLSPATPYTVTAANSGGSSSSTVNLRVKNQAQIVFTSYTALGGAFNAVASGSKNIWKTSVDGVDRVALTMNTNASLDSQNAVFNPAGTSVFYVSKRDLNGASNGAAASSFNVWSSVSDGTAPIALTTNSTANLDSEGSVSFSPDGTKVVFASRGAGGSTTASYNIWTMNVDGTGKLRLTNNTLANLDSHSPVFSSTGVIYYSSLADVSGVNDGSSSLSYNIWKMNADGTGRTPLTTETAANKDCLEPAVSPDGLKIVFSSFSDIPGTPTKKANSLNIWKVQSDGTGLTPLTSNTTAGLDSKNPAFSPDGTGIVFASKMNVNAATANSYNIWNMASDGTGQVALTKNNAAALDSLTPVYAPDQLNIAFSSKMDVGVTPSASSNIWVMNPDGTGLTYVTANTATGLDSTLSPRRVWFQE